MQAVRMGLTSEFELIDIFLELMGHIEHENQHTNVGGGGNQSRELETPAPPVLQHGCVKDVGVDRQDRASQSGDQQFVGVGVSPGVVIEQPDLEEGRPEGPHGQKEEAGKDWSEVESVGRFVVLERGKAGKLVQPLTENRDNLTQAFSDDRKVHDAQQEL